VNRDKVYKYWSVKYVVVLAEFLWKRDRGLGSMSYIHEEKK
jgi:hypothetical protein